MGWLNYHHLLYFWTVARSGSIVAASQELFLSQPAISTQIKSLEHVLGVALFARSGRGLVLTDAGEKAFAYADQIFRLGQELRSALVAAPPSGEPSAQGSARGPAQLGGELGDVHRLHHQGRGPRRVPGSQDGAVRRGSQTHRRQRDSARLEPVQDQQRKRVGAGGDVEQDDVRPAARRPGCCELLQHRNQLVSRRDRLHLEVAAVEPSGEQLAEARVIGNHENPAGRSRHASNG